jgi:hypothetical protein
LSSLLSAHTEKTLDDFKKDFPADKLREETAMMPEIARPECFEISPRFRQSLEQRIERLERDANTDEAQVALLVDGDHIKRQMRMVAIQRCEALRMRLFLDRARTRLPRPLIAP